MNGKFLKIPAELAARTDLPPGAKLLLCVIVDRIGSNGMAWPGVRRLAADCGLTVEGVLSNIGRLERRGLLLVERRGSGRANRYRIPVESAQETLAPEKAKRSGNLNSGAQETLAQALRKPELNYKDPLNQTHKDRRAARGKPDQHRKPAVRWNADERRFDVDADTLARWRKDYPGLDVGRELVKAANWQAVNPLKKDHARFLVNWLNRARPTENGGQAAPEPKRKPKAWSTATPCETQVVPLDQLDALISEKRAK